MARSAEIFSTFRHVSTTFYPNSWGNPLSLLGRYPLIVLPVSLLGGRGGLRREDTRGLPCPFLLYYFRSRLVFQHVAFASLHPGGVGPAGSEKGSACHGGSRLPRDSAGRQIVNNRFIVTVASFAVVAQAPRDNAGARRHREEPDSHGEVLERRKQLERLGDEGFGSRSTCILDEELVCSVGRRTVRRLL